MQHHGFWGLILLILDIWAWINIFQSNRSILAKVLWTFLVLVLPLIGFIIWFFAGPRTSQPAV